MPVLDETKNAKIERERNWFIYVLPSVDVGLVRRSCGWEREGGR